MALKIKCRTDDFRVEELTQVTWGAGPHALYRLRKRSMGTMEAVDAVCRKLRVGGDQVSYGGLKDRYADTIQYLTIFRGPRRRLSQTNLELEYLGQVEAPFSSEQITGNRFTLVVRGAAPEQRTAIEGALGVAQSEGWPNYFDEQRFGSLGVSGEFVAEPWCRGDYERAVWLACAEENSHDGASEKREKEWLREHWGNWPIVREQLGRSERRDVIQFLTSNPNDFRRALAMIRIDLRRLYLAAFQSYLWNEMLSAHLRSAVPNSALRTVSIGPAEVVFPVRWAHDDPGMDNQPFLPLPSARNRDLGEPAASLFVHALRGTGLEPREVRVKYPRDSFFSKGSRATRVVPINLTWQVVPDDLHHGKDQWRLGFDLPRGAYGTLLVKRLGMTQPDAGKGTHEPTMTSEIGSSDAI